KRMLAGPKHRPHSLERVGVAVVAFDVVQQTGEIFGGLPIKAARLTYCVKHMGLELIRRPPGPRNADDGSIEPSAAEHRIERGKDFFVREVAACAEQYQGI